MKPKFFVAVAFILAVFMSTVFSQTSRDFLKTIPPIDENTPEWAKLMYSEDPNVAEVFKLYNEYYKAHSFEKNTHTQNYKSWIRMIEPYLNSDGHFRKEIVEYKNEVFNHESSMRSTKTPYLLNKPTGATWTLHGPKESYNSLGSTPRQWQANVYALDQSISNPSILYAGTESGGVYKTTNLGINWTLITSTLNVKTVHDVKIHPSNPSTVYFSTTDWIYKTTDGGDNWTPIYNINATGYQIYINRNNPDLVYCAAANGFWKSIDAGLSWTKIFTEQTWDVCGHPTNPSIMYILKTNSNGKLNQFFKSTDSGVSWALKTNGWYNSADMNASDAGGRIAVSLASENIIYCSLVGQAKSGDAGWIGVYKSSDAGETWVNTSPIARDGGPYNDTNPWVPGTSHWCLTTFDLAANNPYNQGFFNHAIAVSQINANILYVGNLNFFKSTDGGASWIAVGGYLGFGQDIHPDIQDLLTSLDLTNDRLWMANDGGVTYSDDFCATVPIDRKYGLSASEYWGFGQGWNEDVIVGGRYHNGNSGYVEGYGEGVYKYIGGGESPTGDVNPLESRKAYFNDIPTLTLSSTLAGSNTSSTSLSKYPNTSYNLSKSSEIEWDPRYSDNFYLGNNNIFYKTTDEGITFTALHTFTDYGNIYEIEVSRSNPNVIYCVIQRTSDFYDKVDLFKSTNGGSNWIKIIGDGVGDLFPLSNANKPWKMEISLNPANENELWIANGGAESYTNSNKVYRTTDGGSNWQNMTSTILNDVEIHDILYQGGSNGIVYIATRNGVYYFDPGTSAWTNISTGLPAVIDALQMRPFYRDNKLRVATRGFGIWERDLITSSVAIVQPITKVSTTYCARDLVQFDSYSMIPQTGTSYLWEVTPAPTSISSTTIRNPLIKFGASGTYTIKLTLTNGSNSFNKSMQVIVDSKCDPETVPGKSLSFSTTSDNAQIPDIGITTNTFTISAWVKPNGTQPDYSAIVMNNNGEKMGLNFHGGNNSLGYHWDGSDWDWNSGLVVPSGVWSHVAMVVTPSNVTLYLNGVASVHNSTAAAQQFSSLTIGRFRDWTSRAYKGEIDELFLINRSLTQNEIRELRHITKGSLSGDPAVIAYYQFNQSGSKALDGIGTNHAAIWGSTQFVTSNAPLAGGSYFRQPINSSGTFDFAGTGAKLTFNASGTNPGGELVTARLNVQPDILPSGVYSHPYYWIINNYGTNSFTGLDKIVLTHPGGPSGQAAANPFQVKLYKRTDNGTGDTWVEVLTASSVVAGEAGYYEFLNTGNVIQNFSQFVIGMPESLLPVELSSFTGKRNKDGILLNWVTLTEVNNLGFEIERNISSDSNPNMWATIAFVNGHGSSNSHKKYLFLDMTVPTTSEKISYRLKQINTNGSYYYFEAITVTSEIIPDEYELSQNYPNPFNPTTTIKCGIPENSLVQISIYNMLGEKVLSYNDEKVNAGYYYKEINMNNFASGSYILDLKAISSESSKEFHQSLKLMLLK